MELLPFIKDLMILVLLVAAGFAFFHMSIQHNVAAGAVISIFVFMFAIVFISSAFPTLYEIITDFPSFRQMMFIMITVAGLYWLSSAIRIMAGYDTGSNQPYLMITIIAGSFTLVVMAIYGLFAWLTT